MKKALKWARGRAAVGASGTTYRVICERTRDGDKWDTEWWLNVQKPDSRWEDFAVAGVAEGRAKAEEIERRCDFHRGTIG